MKIRPASIADVETIVEFNQQLALETENKTLPRDIVVPGVRGIFEKPSRGRYFVAEIDGQIVGQVMHTYEWSDWRNGDVWWLQSVYVSADFRGQGVFRALYDHVRQAAMDDPLVVGIRLYVETENTTAQHVYTRLGFTGNTYHVMEEMFPIQ